MKSGALLLVSTLIALLMAEGLVRVLDIKPRPLEPLPIPSYQLSENPVLLYEYRPGYRPENEPWDIKHRGFSINRDGFRDYEYTTQKPENTYRIAVLGDSTTAGYGIENVDDTYPKLLEKRLNRNGDGQLYQVLNMGVGGYHAVQELETLRAKGLKYQPDMVVVCFCINDFHINSDGGVYSNLVDANPHLVPVRNVLRLALKYSRLLFVLYHRLGFSRSTERGITPNRWYEKNVLKGENAVRVGLSMLSELRAQHGFETVIFILPAFTDPFDAYTYEAIHKQFFASAAGLEGIELIDLWPSFQKVNNNAPVFADDSVHMNPYGHSVMVEILYPIIRKH
ncbi:SGNH/GDSL hydrolase family protein, partial [Thermodesulfobacteriota bacterium]